jgi:hypothetical protein
MRLSVAVVLFFALSTSGPAISQVERTPVYDDAFVWQVATRLSKNLIDFQLSSGIPLTDEQRAEFGQQYEILYHNFLLRCDGPLPSLEMQVKKVTFKYRNDTSEDNSLKYEAAMNDKAWLELNRWASNTLVQFMNSFAAGKYGFFPECIVPAFFASNSIPGLKKK